MTWEVGGMVPLPALPPPEPVVYSLANPETSEKGGGKKHEIISHRASQPSFYDYFLQTRGAAMVLMVPLDPLLVLISIQVGILNR